LRLVSPLFILSVLESVFGLEVKFVLVAPTLGLDSVHVGTILKMMNVL